MVLCQDLSVSEQGLCEVASGLIISYVEQETRKLRGDINSFCEEHNLNMSLFCSILRQLDFDRASVFQKYRVLFWRTEKEGVDGKKLAYTGSSVYLGWAVKLYWCLFAHSIRTTDSGV